MRRALHQLDRALGALSVLTRSGPAIRQPAMHDWLQRLGVLQRSPASWPLPRAMARLPWGPGRVQGPEPERPAGVHGTWLQTSVMHPDLYPTFLQVPRRDRADHVRYNSLRYLGQLVRLTPVAAWHALFSPRVSALDDEQLAHMLTQTSLGQFVDLTLEPRDRQRFASFLERAPQAQWARVDLSAVPVDRLVDGVYAAAPVVLLQRLPERRYRVVAIGFDDVVLGPGDGARWQLARYFVMQAAAAQMVLVVHPRLHFPHDVIHIATRQLLPRRHPLRLLLEPHSRFTLGMNHAVANHGRSVVHNPQRELYGAFAQTAEGVAEAFILGRCGRPGEGAPRGDATAHRPFRYGDAVLGDHTAYGQYRQQWLEAMEAFVGELLHDLRADDPLVQRWANEIARWVDGFPDGARIRRQGQLVRAVALHLACVTVFHTADHHSFADLPLTQVPLRLRVAPPNAGRVVGGDLQRLVSREDFFRHYLCHAMFFQPVIIQPLLRTHYDFRSDAARAAVARFRRQCRTLDRRWAASPFPVSEDIANSIQY